MKRKKWSELEELTLLNRYSDLLNSGALAKLKTREKKFKPIAEHVNSMHHLQDPANFPFKWTWRDVSIKVQNMRHQYLGVKQKIRISNNEFNWDDGENHWENFLKYKEVFGDVELEVKSNSISNNNSSHGKRANSVHDGFEDAEYGEEGAAELFGEEDVMGLGFGFGSEDMEEEEEEEEEEDGELGEDGDVGICDGELRAERVEREETEDSGFVQGRKLKRGLCGRRIRMVGAQMLELRDLMLRREDKKREREWSREEDLMKIKQRNMETELRRDIREIKRSEKVEVRELELEERQMLWARREFERRVRLEREIEVERRQRMKLEERLEEENMEWREKMLGMQLEHEKQMMQMYADSCQNQLQILGVISRLICQFLGSANDGLGGGLGTLPPQVLQNLQHPEGLGDAGKPHASSPSEFL